MTTRTFPDDRAAAEFDTLGASLFFSSDQLEQYLATLTGWQFVALAVHALAVQGWYDGSDTLRHVLEVEVPPCSLSANSSLFPHSPLTLPSLTLSLTLSLPSLLSHSPLLTSSSRFALIFYS